MRKTKRFLTVLLTAGMVAAMPCMTAMATETGSTDDSTTTYTITVYAGDVGTIAGKDSYVITGVSYNDPVSLANAVSAAKPDDSDKYYVMGVRKAGRDNREEDLEVASSGFYATGDEDYVIAYGIKGDMVAYTVNYVDENGNALLTSDTYYGNKGDKPVVAYKYVDGYTPDALAITGTLSDNEAENVFTFTYTPVGTAAATVVTTTTTQTAGTAGGTTGTDANATGTDANATGGTDATGGTEGEADEDLTNIPEEETPADQQELRDLDEEDETPAANTDLGSDDDATAKGLPLAGTIGIAAAAAAVLIGIIVAVLKRKRNS